LGGLRDEEYQGINMWLPLIFRLPFNWFIVFYVYFTVYYVSLCVASLPF